MRWGILGTGSIAASFVADLTHVAQAQPYAVGSRDPQRAEAFRSAHGLSVAHGSYAALLADPAVDIVYVATPHPFHAALTTQAIEAGKPTLCEKPFAMRRSQAEAVFELAAQRRVPCMEGLWMRHFPAIIALQERLRAGLLGEVMVVQADFGIRAPASVKRLWKRSLGGGALLDLGIYPVTLASLVFGEEPIEVSATASLTREGIDGQVAAAMRYRGGGLCSFSCSLHAQSSHRAEVVGTKGRAIIDDFFHPSRFLVIEGERAAKLEEHPPVGRGWAHEAQAMMDIVTRGELEHPRMPWRETLALAATLDRLLSCVGVDYTGV